MMTSEKICFEPDELVNLSIMTNIPLVIVEGVDDLPIYQRICNQRDIEVEVYASEMLMPKYEGCEGVKSNIASIRTTLPEFPIENYVVGIIDRDARFFRNEMLLDSAIFILDRYSIENHYADPYCISHLVRQFTGVEIVTEDLSNAIHSEILGKLSFLYYLTLEAIKNACQPEYNSMVGFSNRIREVIGRGVHLSVIDRKDDLDNLAKEFGLVNDGFTLLKITKGKWLLELYFEELDKEIKKLPAKCKAGEIIKCKICAAELEKKCYYSNTSFISGEILMRQSFMLHGLPALDYISDRISSMTLIN